MKKITNFIIDKRYFILVLFIGFTIISFLLMDNVSINYDISKYLPDNSETRIGMNIMEEEFSDTESSTLNVMFEDLKSKDKNTIKKELEEISGVDSVEYNSTKDYNKGKYTLYVITVDGKSDSKTASKVFDKIEDKYKDYTFYTSGDVSEANKTVLSIWIIALAVFCALIILLIMCGSYTEPFLFLATILMAVVLNKGTNIIFPNVSHITDAIASILQMALSMDYSIMLMNRYNQEKRIEKDKVKAMKNALHKAFQSISSSSLTTIVGLLSLVFMSFKIGKDLGFILAKGVLFSLICIFFCLPALILMFDKLITKTKKKSPKFNLTKLAKGSYKVRYLAPFLFLIVFITSFFLKGNLGIDYTDKSNDEISNVFKENNQLAIIYDKKYEDVIASKLSKLEKDSNINEVLGYGNTINQELTYDKLNDKLKDLGSSVRVEDYLLRIIYYNYYNKESSKVTFNEFINFIENDAYNNPNINKKIDNNIKNDINRLKNFTTSSSMNEEKTPNEIASILQIDEDSIKDLFIYYASLNNNEKMTLEEFASFMEKDVLTNNKYSKEIDNDSRYKLSLLSKFSNKDIINKKMTSKEIANTFGIEESMVNELFKYYISLNDIDLRLSINEFSRFVLEDVITNPTYLSSFNEEVVNNIKMLAFFSDNTLTSKEISYSDMASLFGIDKDKVKDIYLIKYLNSKNNNVYKLRDFINYVKVLKENTTYLDTVDISMLSSLENSLIIDNSFSAEELAGILNKSEEDINKIYNLIDCVTDNCSSWVMAPKEFITLVLTNKDTYKNLDNVMIEKLNLLQKVTQLSNQEFTYTDLASLINLDINSTKNIYVLYKANLNNISISPYEFVNLVLKNKDLLGNISSSTINNLSLLEVIMNSTINNYQYNSRDLANILSINSSQAELLYGLKNYLYSNDNSKISLYKFINFILDKVVTNNKYSSSFDNDKVTKLNTVKAIMNDSLNGVKYSNNQMFYILSRLSNDASKDMIEVLYIYYGSNKDYDNTYKLSIEEFVRYLNNDILKDKRFTDYIDLDMRKDIINSKKMISDAKELLVGKKYSRVVLNTYLSSEGKDTFKEIQNIKDLFKDDVKDYYVIGNSPMAYEISKSFDNELNLITIITMVAIFIVVAFTFKSVIIPIILVLIIQCAVYLTMGILSFTGENVYFISILIVQSILMGATIDYAILYTSYYLENRRELSIRDAVISSYNKSIHTILTSSSILTIVTLIIACFTSAIAAKICKTISAGTICSTILILFLLPAVLACFDKLIIKKK